MTVLCPGISQPISSYFLVRFPAREYMAALVLGWGAALLGMGFSKSYATLCVTRFLLGLFEGESSQACSRDEAAVS